MSLGAGIRACGKGVRGVRREVRCGGVGICRNQALSGVAVPVTWLKRFVAGCVLEALGSGGWSPSPAFFLACPEHASEPMQVGGEHRQGDGPLEAICSAASDAVEPAMLQGVDGRLDRRVFAPRGGKGLLGFAFPVSDRQVSLLRQHGEVKQLIKPGPVLRTMEPAIETACTQVREPLLGRPHQRQRHMDILAFPQHLMVQDELVLVLNHCYRNAQRSCRQAAKSGCRSALPDSLG